MRTIVRLTTAYPTSAAPMCPQRSPSIAAPNRNKVAPLSTPPTSSANLASAASSSVRSPNTTPPTKAAMKPLPPRESASPYDSAAPATGTICAQCGSIHPRARA